MKIWERREDESARAYAAFIVYRDMGADRSLVKAQQRLNKAASYVRRLEEWSSRHDWPARAEAWDRALLASHDEKRAALAEALIEEEIGHYCTQLEKWREVWREAAEAGVTTLSIEEWRRLTRWRRDISSMGRLALGMPDKVTENQMTGKGGKDIEFIINVKKPDYDESDVGDGDPDDE